MDNTKSKKNLIALLHFVRDCELDKPFEECNHEVVEACIKLLLKLQGKVVAFTTEQIEDKVRKMPFIFTLDTENEHKRNVRKYSTKKILLIAAIIALLCAILAVFSIGHNIDYWHSVMNDKFGSVHNVPVGEVFENGNKEFFSNGSGVFYKDINDFQKNEKINVLLPSQLPNELSITRIQVSGSKRNIFVCFNSYITSYQISLNTPLSQDIIENANEILSINNLTCYLYRLDDVNTLQIYFTHNNHLYCIDGTDEQILLDIINSLEESE